ncbi:MAG TPA: Fe-S cluster assembly protein SufD [Longimicrobiales bacterium]
MTPVTTKNTPEGVTQAFNREAVATLAESDIQWLGERRLAAWHIYESLPLPTRQLEEWRYTDVSLFKLESVSLARSRGANKEIPAAARAMLDRGASAGHVLFVDDEIAELRLDDSLAAKGVILADLRVAATQHRALVEKHLAAEALPASFNKFAALNAALWNAGVFVYVPRGVRIEEPIRIARYISEGGIAVLPRTLIVADEGSALGYVEEFMSPNFTVPALSCGGVEVIAGNNAKVQYVALQSWGEGVRHIATQRTIAGRDANLDTLMVNLGGSVARIDLAASLEGPGARSDMLGLYFAQGHQHFDHNTRQDHKVPHATSDLLYKGALYDKTRAIFRGIIKVFPKAQRTDAYQTNRNLLLSNRAEATSLPNLEIEADDVRCSHAATVGHLDQEELFYIMTRGVSRREAERLVVFGFFGEVLDRLPMPRIVQELRAAIAERIG